MMVQQPTSSPQSVTSSISEAGRLDPIAVVRIGWCTTTGLITGDKDDKEKKTTVRILSIPEFCDAWHLMDSRDSGSEETGLLQPGMEPLSRGTILSRDVGGGNRVSIQV
jgi:hypothetical protein